MLARANGHANFQHLRADAEAQRQLAARAKTIADLPLNARNPFMLGMTQAGVPVLLDLVAAGCKVKATGFGRVKLDVPATLEAVARKSPDALVFGTDLPSTRAARPFQPVDIDLVEKVLGPELAQKAFWNNPVALYRVTVD